MGGLGGHVVHGFGILAIGLWQTFHHIKLHAKNPKSYTSLPWFPTSRIKYFELYFIMIATSISLVIELYLTPYGHHLLDPDGTIPSNHFRLFEHGSISLTFFMSAFLSIVLDKLAPPDVQYGLTYLLYALAFGQQLLLFHLHSTDHVGLEGQYHWLLQIVISVSFSTTLLGISHPHSFLNSFVRSASIVFQGVWFFVIGYTLMPASLMRKGCYMSLKKGHIEVRCHGEEALDRAISLANIQFSWFVLGMTTSMVTLYLVMIKYYLYHNYKSSSTDYCHYSLTNFHVLDQDHDNDGDVEEATNNGKIQESNL
ncbi:uncharacterized protein [Henckelia pumila]|uniref:uncharacterized protein n=1 Tax=Henckelia pumila TaxID=405737 RepID=UPI003C6E13F8